MINLVKSEVLKIRSTQVWIWMLLMSLALTALGTIGNVVMVVDEYKHEATDIRYYDVFTQSGSAAVALLVLGLLGLTTEFRHKTITPTLLATPNRWRLVGGKAASYGVFAALYAAFCVGVNFAIAIIWLNAENVPISYDGVGTGVLKTYIGLVLFGLFGLAIGALIRNQAAAMVFGIVYLFILDNLLNYVPWVRKGYAYTPGGAIKAFLSNGHVEGMPGDVHLLAPIAGGLLMVVWVVGLLLLSTELMIRRDIS